MGQGTDRFDTGSSGISAMASISSMTENGSLSKRNLADIDFHEANMQQEMEIYAFGTAIRKSNKV